MKRIIVMVALLLFAGVGIASAQVKFEKKTTEEISKMAAAEGKFVFIDLYADWCPPCRLMEKQVFSQKDVGEYMSKNFVSAKYNVDEKVGKDLLTKYGKGSIPTYVVLDAKGEVLGTIVGAADKDTFVKKLDEFIDKK